jgi:hypothetical protein
MVGLIFLFVLILYVGIAWLIVKALPSKKAKYIVIAAFALIPTWDVAPGWLYFWYLCETEGGVKVYKSVENVDGFLDKSQNMLGRDAVMKYGYQFMEGSEGGSQLYRYSNDPNGQLLREKIDESTSKYGVLNTSSRRPFNIRKFEDAIVDLKTHEKMAVRIKFFRAGNWVQAIVAPLFGGGAFCPRDPSLSPINENFYLNTLKPSKVKVSKPSPESFIPDIQP